MPMSVPMLSPTCPAPIVDSDGKQVVKAKRTQMSNEAVEIAEGAENKPAASF